MTSKKAPPQMPTIHFEAPLLAIDQWMILQVPEEKSLAFSSRGQVSVVGTVGEHEFSTVLEPDGRWSHWFKIDENLQKTLDVKAGDVLSVELTQSAVWPEPSVPDDFAQALVSAPETVQEMWHDITPMARWEWIRWVNATRDTSTRKRRVEVSISKMKSGKRRPCCFNLAACTDPDLSRNGRLMESTKV